MPASIHAALRRRGALSLAALLGVLLAAASAAEEQGDLWYRVVVKDHGTPVKEHVARLAGVGADVVLHSTTKEDYRFAPAREEEAPRRFGAGPWRAFALDRPLALRGTPVQVREEGEGFLIAVPNGLTLELERLRPALPPAVTLPWQAPFRGSSRAWPSLASRVVSPFGAGRTSFHAAHLHTGTDLAGVPSEPVYPIGPGVVEFVSHWEFEGTVVVRHRLASGESLWSKYVHVRDPGVRAGDVVAVDTPLARLFTPAEFSNSGFKHNHLHLEVRRDYSDHGHASTHSINTDELARCCIDPLVVLRQ